MILRQKSAFDGFTFEFVDETRTTVLGGFSYAWFSQAKNARLRFHGENDAAKGDIQMMLNGKSWRVRHLYLSRGHLSDIRYTLEADNDTVHAQVEVLGKSAGQRLPRIVMTNPVSAELGTSSGWLKKSYAITDSAKRELVIELAGVAPPVAAFLGIVALIVRY
jgi:hypothetical protein